MIMMWFIHLGYRIIRKHPNEADMGKDGETTVGLVSCTTVTGKSGLSVADWTSTALTG